MSLRIEQAYYTRANKQLFTGQAGYGVSAASGGVTKEMSAAYVNAIGDAIALEGERDWLYAIMPAFDGRISIAKAIPAFDGVRPCYFAHMLLAEGVTPAFLQTAVARFTSFCDHYVGEPVGLDTLTEIPDLRSDNDPNRLTLQDAGFDAQSMTALVNSIAMLHENRSNRPNSLQYIFIVYQCPREAFEEKAFNLVSLLYAALPYVIVSKLGVAIKTDNAWRESYPTGYASAYWNETTKQYIPGVDLYILNQPVIPVPRNGHVFTVGKAGVYTDIDVALNAQYRDIITDITGCMNTVGTPDSGLFRFYQFLQDACGENLSFANVCNLYQLAQVLSSPELAENYNWKQIHKTLRLLNVCINDHFDRADPYWHRQSGLLLFEIIKRGESLAKEEQWPTENICVELLEAGRYISVKTEQQPLFIESFYDFLIHADMVKPENEKLIDALVNAREIFIRMIECDKTHAYQLTPVCEVLLAKCTAEALPQIVVDFGSYTAKEVFNALYAALRRLTDNGKNSDNIPWPSDSQDSVVMKFARMFSGYLNCNYNPPGECHAFFQHNAKAINSFIKNYAPKEAWVARYRLYYILAEETDENVSVGQVWSELGTLLTRFLNRKERENLDAVQRYRDFLYHKRMLNFKDFATHECLSKYLALLNKPFCMLDWNRLINDLFNILGKNNTLEDCFGVFFKVLAGLWEFTTIDYESYAAMYQRLKTYVSEHVRQSFGLVTIFEKMIRQYAGNDALTLMIKSLHAVSRVNEQFNNFTYDTSAYKSVCCDKCGNLTPVTYNADKLACRHCGRKLSTDDKGKNALLIQCDAAVLNALLVDDKNAKKAALKNAESGDLNRASKAAPYFTILFTKLTGVSAKADECLSGNKYYYTCCIAHTDNLSSFTTLARLSGKMPCCLIISDGDGLLPVYDDTYEHKGVRIIHCNGKNRPNEMIEDLAIEAAWS